jgi:hypothetical protein
MPVNIFSLPKKSHACTPNEIDVELRKLYGLENRVPAITAFGDNNQEAIQAQIEVIERNLSLAQVTDEYEDDDDYVMSGALGASEWLRNDGQAPSGGVG